MLEFYHIVFIYGKKIVNNLTLSKLTFIAFIKNIFSKKTYSTLDYREKTS
ncbi:Uncharacterised protein [Flavobacterium hibernum]|nr:Uncharacterised protein [Flavobacterium hibernum]